MINWINLTSPFYWQVSLGAYNVIINSTKVISLSPIANNAIFDSGSLYTYLPSIDYNNLYSAIISNTTLCTKNVVSGLIYCNCTSTSDARFMNVSITFGNRYIFYLNNSDYLTYDATKKQCSLTFVENTDPSVQIWIMGTPIFRAYYIIHDLQM